MIAFPPNHSLIYAKQRLSDSSLQASARSQHRLIEQKCIFQVIALRAVLEQNHGMRSMEWGFSKMGTDKIWSRVCTEASSWRRFLGKQIG